MLHLRWKDFLQWEQMVNRQAAAVSFLQGFKNEMTLQRDIYKETHV